MRKKHNSLFNNFQNALINLSKEINSLKPKEKHRYVLQIKKSCLSLNEARNLGFNFTAYMWKNCENEEIRNKGI